MYDLESGELTCLKTKDRAKKQDQQNNAEKDKQVSKIREQYRKRKSTKVQIWSRVQELKKKNFGQAFQN